MMRRVRKLALAFTMSLTAAMTLIAAFPHFECRCPDGHLKPYCLGFCSTTSGCCGESCCEFSSKPSWGVVSHPAKSAGRPPCCCCKHKERQPAKRQRGGFHVNQPPCVKSAAQPESWTSSDAKTTVAKDQTLRAVQLPLVVAMPSDPRKAWEPASWQEHGLAPPADLVTLLQHYLI
jgi:hypothetical protein